MATKLGKSTFPTGHGPNDFAVFGPPATKDGQFEATMICDLGCFTQDGKDTNKYYHGAVVQSKKTQQWFPYFEWGRQGATNPQFQFVACSSKAEAESEYASQLHAKNDKRGQWVNHPQLGKILQAKPGKDCYLVRPQATRSTGLPDAKTIRHDVAPKITNKKTGEVRKFDSQTIKLMQDLNVATVNYARGSMADSSLPTAAAIKEGRDILNAALHRLQFVGTNLDAQINDKDLIVLTNTLYGRIPKKKDRNAPASTWILSQNNVDSWQQDLDAFESALATVDSDSIDNEADPFGGMPIKMEWMDPRSSLGEFIHYWVPKATRNKHSYLNNMKVHNAWKVERNDEPPRFMEGLNKIGKEINGSVSEFPFHQPTNRPDLNSAEISAYKAANCAMLFHGTRSVNVSGLLREGFRFPTELVNVHITNNMFSGGLGGIYFADDWGKSAGYTSLENAYYSHGAGAIRGRHAFLLICDSILGNPHVAPKPHPYTAYPAGTHCIFGKGGHTSTKNGFGGKLQNNEWIILQKNQYRFRYLIEFSA